MKPACCLIVAVCTTLLIAASSTALAGEFEMVCQEFCQSGGRCSSANFSICISATGQSSTVGTGGSGNFRQFAGFVYATQVLYGDANGDAIVNITDVVHLINYIFAGGPPPNPRQAGDADCDDLVNISDAVYLIRYIFSSGQPPCTDCP